jgi:hypothetical protein
VATGDFNLLLRRGIGFFLLLLLLAEEESYRTNRVTARLEMAQRYYF